MQAGRGLLYELFALVLMAHLHSDTGIMDHSKQQFYLLQIDPAARGCISGRLAEWPHLAEALRQHGYRLAPDTPARDLKTICREILNPGDQGAHR